MSDSAESYEELLRFKWLVNDSINNIVALLRQVANKTWHEEWEDAYHMLDMALDEVRKVRAKVAEKASIGIKRKKEEKPFAEEVAEELQKWEKLQKEIEEEGKKKRKKASPKVRVVEAKA